LKEAAGELELLLRDAIGMQMQADVSLGAFLSGGLDSSTVVALMQAQTSRPVRTFCIGFSEQQFNESAYARSVAGHLGTNHSELNIDARSALDVIPTLPHMYDEPLGDSSQIPTFLVARLARAEVKVCVSGDGGDEIFCGYQKYRVGHRIATTPMRRVLGRALSVLPFSIIEKVASPLSPRFRRAFRASRIHNLSLLLQADFTELAELLSAHLDARGLTPDSECILPEGPQLTAFRPSKYLRAAMDLDLAYYLPDNVLTKVDRATMRVGLESRAPLLDHRIYEFTSRVPMELLYKDGHQKPLLREVLTRYVPSALIDRPKSGFSIPLSEWISHELNSWAHDLVSDCGTMNKLGMNSSELRRLLNEHESGRRDHGGALWPALSLVAWATKNL
jgi:asparagine synthase (glutamine-hydrolysing)